LLIPRQGLDSVGLLWSPSVLVDAPSVFAVAHRLSALSLTRVAAPQHPSETSLCDGLAAQQCCGADQQCNVPTAAGMQPAALAAPAAWRMAAHSDSLPAGSAARATRSPWCAVESALPSVRAPAVTPSHAGCQAPLRMVGTLRWVACYVLPVRRSIIGHWAVASGWQTDIINGQTLCFRCQNCCLLACHISDRACSG